MKLTGRVMRSNSINGGVVDNAIYVDGVRTANPATLHETYELLRERHGIAWIGLYRATSGVIGSVAAEFGLHHLVVDDAIAAHQRPKLERYGTILFTVLRPARYIDRREQVEFGELHVVTGDGFVVTIQHAESPDLASVRRRLEAFRALLQNALTVNATLVGQRQNDEIKRLTQPASTRTRMSSASRPGPPSSSRRPW